jgi:hypothetical protein
MNPLQLSWALCDTRIPHANTMRRLDHLALACLSLVVACSSNRGAGSTNARHPGRFRDVSAVVVADSGEARPIPGTGYLRYPEQERIQSIEAALLMAFVMDTTGHAEHESVSFIGGAPRAFLDEACLWLRSQRFTPVQREGTVRRALVVTDLTFTLHPGPVGDVHLTNRAPPVNVERRRRDFAAKGVEAAAHELTVHRHC